MGCVFGLRDIPSTASLGVEVLPALERPRGWCGSRGSVRSIAFAPDGKHIFLGGDRSATYIYDVESRVWNHLGDDYDFDLEITSAAFSSDGTRLVSASSMNGTISIWDVKSGKEYIPQAASWRNDGHTVGPVAFSPDDTHIVCGSWDCNVRVWDATLHWPEDLDERHLDTVDSVAFSPDGTRVVSGSADLRAINSSVPLWNAQSGAHIFNVEMPLTRYYRNVTVAFSPDGTRTLSCSDASKYTVCDAATGEVISERVIDPEKYISSVSIFPSTADGWLEDSSTRRSIFQLPAIVEFGCLSQHERSLAIGCDNGQVIIMHLPEALFTCAETRPAATGKGRHPIFKNSDLRSFSIHADLI